MKNYPGMGYNHRDHGSTGSRFINPLHGRIERYYIIIILILIIIIIIIIIIIK